MYPLTMFAFPGISWNVLISQKLPGKDQDFLEFGKFPSKWKHCQKDIVFIIVDKTLCLTSRATG